jgi:hypothetical protein
MRHVQRLVSVVKMATVLEECSAKEQRSFVGSLWANELNAKGIPKKCFMFTVGSVRRVTRVTTGWQTFL